MCCRNWCIICDIQDQKILLCVLGIGVRTYDKV